MTHPGAQYLAEQLARIIGEWERNREPWNMMPEARQSFIERSAASLLASEKARADAAVAELVKAISKKNDELFDAEAECSRLWDAARSTEATLSTLTAERNALERERDEAREAILTVVSAVRSYLPPDGDDEQTFASNVIAAVDNPRINPLINEWEQENGGA